MGIEGVENMEKKKDPVICGVNGLECIECVPGGCDSAIRPKAEKAEQK